MEQQNPSSIGLNLSSRSWRLKNLYYITSKNGQNILFSPNWTQRRLYDEIHYCNIILKARQLGISTFICILFLDAALWNSNTSCGIIAQTREDAEYLFRKISHAYNHLDPKIKQIKPIVNDSSRELRFSNGSSVRVGTSMRGSTFQYLHISEFGKICSKYPEKASEIITGSLNTVAAGQHIFIESTAEGREGYFYDMCKKAQNNKHELTPLDYKFHFFPWYQEPTYNIGSQVALTPECLEYFESLELRGIKLEAGQKYWYALKESEQKQNMLREYPSTPEEAWESAIDGSYYSRNIALARIESRICRLHYDETIPVSTAWDLGYNDSTAIWFFQMVNKEIHLIEYIEGSGESLAHWLGIVKQKDYIYDKHLAPHDIMAHEYSSGINRQTAARKMGFNLIPVPRTDINNGIDVVRGLLSRCYFDETKCSLGIKCLENYKKEWNDKHGCWSSKPLHNQYSHGADAFRTLATGMAIINAPKQIDARNLGRQHSIFR